ncbi:MAG: hypothetical protein HZB53_18705 [Chloroflexi bacterium]|nr:hypothetical protein [Chloroflexota bacterium]
MKPDTSSVPRLALACVAIATCALYVGMTIMQVGRPSFPLDDAWIHLTFARNIAQYGQMAYIPGQLSAGSTAPLWTLLLSPGFVWPFGPEAWIYLLGMVCLCAASMLAGRISTQLFPEARGLRWVIAFTLAFEWHLGWAAFSGMETLFFTTLMLLALDTYLSGCPLWLVGLLGGLLAATRPEGMALAGLIGLAQLARTGTRIGAASARMRSLIALATGVAVPLIPYVAFNWLVSGTLLPNTFFAKQMEFAEITSATPFTVHLVTLSAIMFVGAQLVLVPGFLAAAWLILRERRTDAAVLLGWWLAITLAFAIRLPSTFQHGRYEMPVLPSVLVLGWWGTWRIGRALARRAPAIERVARKTWLLTFGTLLLAFWIRGAQALATDAAIMDCIGVQTARWLGANTRSSDMLAVHDIGAVGYFLNGRPVLDMAGLITPDVIPWMRDEPRLLQYIIDRGAVYIVSSDAWHERLLHDARVQFVHANDCRSVLPPDGYAIGVYRIVR